MLILAGQITLIQSTICAIPEYVMQTTRLHKSTCDEIDWKICRFLWGEQARKGESI